MRSLLLVHMSCGVSEGGIRESTKEVCRNLIKSMPRRMEAMIKAKECQTKCKQKTAPSRVLYCKIYIRTVTWTKLLYFGMTKDKMSIFVIKISHRFTFVI